MPPTDAVSDYGPIALYEPISDSEGVLLQRWFQAGMPEGERKTVSAPARFDKWPMGPPDVVLHNSRPVAVDPEGPNYWRVFTVPLGAHVGRHLRAFDIRPTSPTALRSASLAYDVGGAIAAKIDKAQLRDYRTAGSMMVGSEALIGSWAPGYVPWRLPDGVALASSTAKSIAIQAQYRPTGKLEDGGFEIALYFAKQPAPRRARWATLGSRDFRIEPGDSPTLEATRVAEVQEEVLAVMPEARLLASNVEISFVPSSGSTRTILKVRSWDPYWPGAYRLPSPASLAPGDRIVARVSYNNDKHSARNEGKTPRLVEFGQTLDDELFWVHVLVVPAAGKR